MVKVPKGEPTPIEPRRPPRVGAQPPPDLCPLIEIEIPIPADVPLSIDDHVSVHVREGAVRLQRLGQVIAHVEEAGVRQTIVRCHEAGSPYEGRVTTVALGRAVVLLGSPL